MNADEVEMHEIHKRADGLLADLIFLSAELKGFTAKMQADVDRVKASYAQGMEKLFDELKSVEKELLKLQKKNKKDLFKSDSDRLDLPHGALLYAIERPVKRVKGMLATLEKMGLSEAIKTNPAVNWDEIEKWNDEKLKAIGTERIEKERFEYELTGIGHGA